MILFLVAFKDSPLSWAGLSYERINAVHRWVGRTIVGIFLAHGIMMGYLQCVRDGLAFTSWIGRSDVRTGVIAFIFLFLLLILYPLPSCQLTQGQIDGFELIFMRSFDVRTSS